MKVYLNNDWQFFKDWSADVFAADSVGEAVRLPHTNVVTPFNYFDDAMYQFVCGYKRVLHLDDIKGKTFLLTFEAIAHYAEVYVNGTLAATHSCGYTAFTTDITPFVHDGDNVVVVKADSNETLDLPPFGYVIDYMTYGGIYREAYLDVKEGVYVADAFVSAEPGFPVHISGVLGNFTEQTDVIAQILDGEKCLCTFTAQATTPEFIADPFMDNPVLWSVDNPKLYTLRLSAGNDVWQTQFGVRSAKFTSKGFFLNGQKLKIVGLNRHQSYPYVGYAMPKSMQKLDARLLKNTLCVNAVRTSHYPQSQHFLDECDRLGLLVFTEIPGWQHIGSEKWQEQAVQNVKEMVLQYRNHPSVVLWGVRINESQDCDELYRKTNSLAHELDSTRQTAGVRYLKKSSLLEDVYTFNDFKADGATNRNEVCSPKAPYMVTEFNGHMFPTKTFDDASHRLEHVLRYAKKVDDVMGADKTCGCFGWCMFDYNTHKDFGSGDRICYHGVMDMFRNVKDAAYVYSSFGTEPVLHACFTADAGDYPEGVIGDLYVATNCDYIKVYRGGNYIGVFDKTDSPYKSTPHPLVFVDDLIGQWLENEEGFSPEMSKLIRKCIADVQRTGVEKMSLRTKLAAARIMRKCKLTMDDLTKLYTKYTGGWGSAANEVALEGYVGDKLVATQRLSSPNRVDIKLTPSATTLTEGKTYDVAEVFIEAVDQNGNRCPYVNKALTFRTEGAIELIGDPVVAMQGGAWGCYVKTTGKLGSGSLFVNDVEIKFNVVSDEVDN